MRLLHVPQQYFERHLVKKDDINTGRFSFKCFMCERINQVTITNVDDWILCTYCKHEHLAQDFFNDEQLFTLRLASTNQLVDLLRLARVTLNGRKQDRICQKIGHLLGISGDWRDVLGHVDKNHRTEVEQSRDRQKLPFIF